MGPTCSVRRLGNLAVVAQTKLLKIQIRSTLIKIVVQHVYGLFGNGFVFKTKQNKTKQKAFLKSINKQLKIQNNKNK
jgi:hypothetical protein